MYCVESFLESGKDVTILGFFVQGVSCLDFLLEQVEDKLQSYNVAEVLKRNRFKILRNLCSSTKLLQTFSTLEAKGYPDRTNLQLTRAHMLQSTHEPTY